MSISAGVRVPGRGLNGTDPQLSGLLSSRRRREENFSEQRPPLTPHRRDACATNSFRLFQADH